MAVETLRCLLLAELVVESRRRSDRDQLIFGTVRKGQRESAGGQKFRLLRPPGCCLQIGVPAGVVDAELEVEVVEVVELLPLKLLPLLLQDSVHGSADQLLDGLQQLPVKPVEKIIHCRNLEPEPWNLNPPEDGEDVVSLPPNQEVRPALPAEAPSLRLPGEDSISTSDDVVAEGRHLSWT